MTFIRVHQTALRIAEDIIYTKVFNKWQIGLAESPWAIVHEYTRWRVVNTINQVKIPIRNTVFSQTRNPKYKSITYIQLSDAYNMVSGL